jgi:ParB-like chromosome segregation protein Spo0J
MVVAESPVAPVLAAAPEQPFRIESSEVVELAIGDLRIGPSMRERGIDAAHVATLAEVADSWPPIVVNRADAAVVDGQHRVAAAKQLGIRTLRAVWFNGSPDDSYVEFVRCNVGHGLPLTLAERRLAARRIVCSRPELSDRRIAVVCALSPRTVARLREEAGAEARRINGNGSAPAKGRIGRDGRVRPIDPVAVRARIAKELTRRPDASLRTIANAVGASPETVRSVRNEMRAAVAANLPDAHAKPEVGAKVLGLLERKAPGSSPVRGDPAFTDRDGGQQFVGWFDTTCVEPGDLYQYVESVPLSRVYEIADEARRRAEFWTRFAVALEGRVRRRA